MSLALEARMIADAELLFASHVGERGARKAGHFAGLRRFPRHVELLSAIGFCDQLPMQL